MTEPIDRVSVEFSRFCEKEKLFQNVDTWLYRNHYYGYHITEDEVKVTKNIFPNRLIGPAPADCEMDGFLEDQGYRVRLLRVQKYALYRKFSLSIAGKNSMFQIWLKSSHELKALQEAVKIVANRNKEEKIKNVLLLMEKIRSGLSYKSAKRTIEITPDYFPDDCAIEDFKLYFEDIKS